MKLKENEQRKEAFERSSVQKLDYLAFRFRAFRTHNKVEYIRWVSSFTVLSRRSKYLFRLHLLLARACILPAEGG